MSVVGAVVVGAAGRSEGGRFGGPALPTRVLLWLLLLTLGAPVAAVAQGGAPKTGPAPRAAAPRASFAQLSADAAKARDEGRTADAIALYRRAVALRPAWDEGQWYLGTLLYESGTPKAARAAFAQVLRRQPEHAGAMAMSGLCAFQAGDHDTALRELLRARQMNIQSTPELATVVRYHTAILLTRFGEFEAGNRVLVELAAEGQESPQAIDAFGLNLLRMPLLPAEIPTDARPRVQLAGEAGFAMATRQVARAKTLVERLVAEYGSTPNVHYVHGVFLLSEDPAQALALFRKELEISPAHVPARLQLAFELVKQGDPGAARSYAEDAARIAPQEFGPHLAMGQVLLGLGELAPAIAAIEQAVTLAPGSPQVHYLASVAYARAGRAADAERARREFTRLNTAGPR